MSPFVSTLLRSAARSPLPQAATLGRRPFAAAAASSSSSPQPPALPAAVPLPFEFAPAPSASTAPEGEAFVIAHGLFGSKQNWRSLTKAFAQDLQLPVYALDLRNHGTAPHAEPHTYLAMAADVGEFLRQHKLTKVHLMGHSMGGKVVMTVALHSALNAPVKSLISVDMAPSEGRISPEFKAYTKAMMEIEAAGVATRAEADKLLSETEPALPVRQFLLTNAEIKDGQVGFRNPLAILDGAIGTIGEFPFAPGGGTTWPGPTLFVKGTKSAYINRHNSPRTKEFFPNSSISELETGHWVHAEQPRPFMRLVGDFVKAHRSS